MLNTVNRPNPVLAHLGASSWAATVPASESRGFGSPSTHMPCEACGAIAASLIFIDGTTLDDFEKCARLMYPDTPAAALRSGLSVLPWKWPEPERAADILKVWPTREPLQRIRPQEFNPKVIASSSSIARARAKPNSPVTRCHLATSLL